MPTLTDILDERLDPAFKGFPPEREPFRVGDVPGQDLRLFRGDQQEILIEHFQPAKYLLDALAAD